MGNFIRINPDKVEAIVPSINPGVNAAISIGGVFYNVQETVDQILNLMVTEQVNINAATASTPIPTKPAI